MTNKFKKQFVKSFLVLSLFAIGGATTHNIARGDTFSAIDAANKGGQLNKQDRKDLENAIKSGQVVYDTNANPGKKWSYVGNNYTQSSDTKQSRSDASLNMLDSEQKAIVKKGKDYQESSKTGVPLKGQQTAELPGKSDYTAEDIKAATKRANDGTSKDGDDKILQFAKDKGIVAQSEDTGKYEATSNYANSYMWNLYSILLMQQKDAKQKETAVLGKGDVSVDLSYSMINSKGNRMAAEKGDPLAVGNKPGTALASTLATFTHYNYFSTVSGNSLAQGRDSFFPTLGRFVGGLLALLASYISQATSIFKNELGNFLITFNPYYIFWDNTKGITSDNVLVSAVSELASKIGFSGENLKLIFSFVFIVITAVFCYRLMRNISRDGVTKRGILTPTGAWFMRIIPVFVILPLLSLCSGYVIVSVTQMDLPVSSAVATKYLVNARNWASARNLSPSGGVDAVVPYASKEDGFIDKSYAPQTLKGDEAIKSINQNGYIWATNNPGITEEEISTQLISSWIENSTFNVNTYAGDAVLSDSSGAGAKASTAVTAYNASELRKIKDKPYAESEVKSKDGKTNAADINYFEDYLWSVSQSPNETQVNPESYNSGSTIGMDGMSFSNQSVALLLQSSFDGSKAHFYAYNISPTGTQAAMKSLSTVKTEWRETTLVGTSVIGQISSWVGLVGGYASLVMINFSIVMILADIGIFGALYAFIKNIIDTVRSGNGASAFGTFIYFFLLIAIGVLSLTVPTIIYDFIVLLTSVINGKLNVESIGGMFEGLILVFISWLFCIHNYKKGWGETGLGKVFKGLLSMADQAANKMHSIVPNYNDFSARNQLQNVDRRIDETKYKIRNKGIYNNGSGSLGNPNIPDNINPEGEIVGAGAGFAAGAAGATVVNAASKHRSYGGSSVVPNTKPTSPTTQTPTASRVTGSNVAKVPSARDSFTKTPDGSKIGTSLPTEKPKLTTQTPSAKSSFSNNDSKLNQVRLARDVAKASRGDVKSARKVMDEVKQRVPMAENDQPVVKKPAIIPSRPSKADEVRNTRGQLNDFKSDK